MYVAKVNDRGRASCVYMFDEQLINFDEMFSKSYFVKKSTDKQSMLDFSKGWNKKHKDVIYKNDMMYYINVFCKGVLQAPALVVLYACIVMGAMLLFGSENFYEQINLYGVEAFGSVRNAIIITYIVCAVLGLLASLTTYNNVRYKFIRCIISIITFVIVSPVIFEKLFFTTSNTVLTVTIIAIAGCFVIRFLFDRLIMSVVRKNTEKMIRAEHKMTDIETVSEIVEKPVNNSGTVSDADIITPIMEKVRNNQRLTQYRRK